MKYSNKLVVLMALSLGGICNIVGAAPAVNPAGTGPGISIGTNSNTNNEAGVSIGIGSRSWGKGVVIGNNANNGNTDGKSPSESIAIGNGAHINYANGAAPTTGDVAIGSGAYIHSYMSQSGSVAIGKNAYVENMIGAQESMIGMGQTEYGLKWGLFPDNIPKSPEKLVTGLAIGENTYARTGSIMIGNHKYDGAIGDITVESNNTKVANIDVMSTTVGTNSYNKGIFATVTGAYSAITGSYDGNGSIISAQNFGANVVGSLNTIESATSSNLTAGMANSIVGVANRTSNSNGTLIMGAGNIITNSLDPKFYMSTPGRLSSAKALQDKLMDSIRESNSGGAVLALGGGNKADYVIKSQLIGVNNTITGKEGAFSTHNLVNGYKNNANNVNHVAVIGTENTIEDTNYGILIGDKRQLIATNNSVVIGSADKITRLTVADAVVLGHDANVEVEGGIALGSGSIAVDNNESSGYDVSTRGASTKNDITWKPTLGAVSLGKAGESTRRITNLAAGIDDTDAVNVAQLKTILGNQNDNISNIDNRVNNVDLRLNKVGAGAAALAGLHPLDFDPNDKLNFAASYGNYKDSHSLAIGAFYRPDEKTMFSIGGNMGNGENMINVGVSLKFGKHSLFSGYSRNALINVITEQSEKLVIQDKQIQEIAAENQVLKAQMAEVMAQLAKLANK